MKITFDASEFAAAVAWTARFAPTAPTMTAYGGILIDATAGDAIVLCCQDPFVTARRTVAGQVATPGRVLVAARLLSDLLAKLPQGGDVELALDGEQLSVVAGGSRFRLRRMDAKDFPSGHAPSGQSGSIEMSGRAFSALVGRVAPAASADPARPVLSGVKFALAGGRVSAVATDTYRLAVESIAVTSEAADMSMLIPARAAIAAAKAAETTETATLEFSEKAYRLTAGPMEVAGSLLEGTYPAWEALLPDSEGTSFVVDVAAMHEVIDRFAVLAAATKSMVPTRLRIAPGEAVEVSADHPDLGDGVDHVEAESEGAPLTIAFNPTLLVASLDAIPTARARFALRDDLKPALVTPADPTLDVDEAGADGGSDIRLVVMPMRT